MPVSLWTERHSILGVRGIGRTGIGRTGRGEPDVTEWGIFFSDLFFRKMDLSFLFRKKNNISLDIWGHVRSDNDVYTGETNISHFAN